MKDLSLECNHEIQYMVPLSSIQNCVIGKSLIQDTDTHSSITTMEHYIPLTNSSLNQISPNNSPRSIPLCLIPCSGCRLNDIYLTNYDTRVKCTINSRTDRLSTFNIYHMHSSHSAHSIHLASHNIITPSLTSKPLRPSLDTTSDTFKISSAIINSALLCDNSIKTILKDIAFQFINFNNFQFFSDGSVSNIRTTDSKSDSQNCIDTYNTRLNMPTISPHQRLKQNNFLIWDLIFWIIAHNKLTIQLLKVKAHSNNKYNDIADDLAKLGHYISDPILINHKFFHQSSLGLINLYNNIYIVDRNVCKWSDVPIQSRSFNMAMNNSALSPINHQIKHGLIDWDYTKKWINYNPLDSPTSEKLRNIQVDKVKKATFNYPTGNILQRNYPDLYPLGRIKCTNCNTYEDSNAHIGLCPKHRTFISSLLEKYKIKLIELIRNNNDSSFTFDIESSINASNMFKLLPDILNLALLPDEPSSNSSNLTIVPCEQPWILLLHHLIPIDLSTFFFSYFSKKCDRDRYFIKFLSDFTTELKILTWSSRSLSFKRWEKSLNITSKKKKNYHRLRLSSRQTLLPPTDLNRRIPT
ncbi:hypothetical protein RhiirA5_428759 [Rhizophagus irregularis]|uniref:RNase H type-1 domain-containing protein n=1 Tax=Rhizophagus irregularis TaxID=588596 RepID=A0A2N0NZR6_9GLOM|nr:hypothetical protein RhiirA5_428759 [Rhizophagus irregularis]